MKTNGEEQIGHVSDTALMVAACRALESSRADGLFHDRFAAKLAGARGDAILHGITGWQLMCFGIAVRTRFIDDLITETITEQGIQVVLSVGAGLDARPWRLKLPAELRWIEVDFTEILTYKARVMAGELAHCRLERIAADITDSAQIHAVFDAAAGAPVLMITEGLLMYLAGSAVETLATVAAGHRVRRWLLDCSALNLVRSLGVDTGRAIQSVRAPDHLEGTALLDAVRSNGWNPLRFRSYAHDVAEIAADRIAAMRRSYTEKGLPLPAAPLDDTSGVYLFGS